MPFFRIRRWTWSSWRRVVPLLGLLLTVGCLAQWWWGIEVVGQHGRVRVLDPTLLIDFGQSGDLYDLPALIQEFEYVGETPQGPLLLAALPACGYAFDAWGSRSEPDAFLSIEPSFLRYRRVEVSFSQSSVDRNDCFATPQPLAWLEPSGSVEFDNRRAGFERDEPEHARSVFEEEGDTSGPSEHYGGAGATLWWTFEAPVSGVLRFDVESDFQSVIAVYQGSSFDDLDVLEACVRVGGCRGVEVPVDEGASLRIAIDGCGEGCIGCPASLVAIGPTGSGVLHWRFVPSEGAGASQ